MTEQRKFTRVVTQFEVRYRLLGQSTSQARLAWTQDLGEGGMRLGVNELLGTGGTIQLTLRRGPEEAWWPEVKGTVVWQDESVGLPDRVGQRPTGIYVATADTAFRSRVQNWLNDQIETTEREPGLTELREEQICSRCILTATVPGINFSHTGVCNFCVDYEKREAPKKKNYVELERKMLRALRVNPKKHQYDCLCLYSGGKDSSYMLYLLANKYKLRVLAFTFDNWFIPTETYRNINKVLEKTNVDHIVLRPSWDLNKSVFRTGMEESHRLENTKELAFMIGHACWPCFTQISVHSMRLAIEKNIPNVVIGTTPGQIRQKRYNQVSKFGGIFDVYKNMVAPMLKLLSITGQKEQKEALTLSFSQKLRALRMRLVPFYEHVPYNENLVIRTVQKEFGWEKPKSTDSCSSNCQLNSLGIEIHKKKYGLSPYVIPLARDVREGLVDRNEALKAVKGKLNSKLVTNIASKLDVEV